MALKVPQRQTISKDDEAGDSWLPEQPSQAYIIRSPQKQQVLQGSKHLIIAHISHEVCPNYS